MDHYKVAQAAESEGSETACNQAYDNINFALDKATNTWNAKLLTCISLKRVGSSLAIRSYLSIDLLGKIAGKSSIKTFLSSQDL